jgi:uncharacterized Zn-binding protein involved in type VI secretion
MAGASRINDTSFCPVDAHGCPLCPHQVSGPAITGSADVLINGIGALRVGDSGFHVGCCGPNNWKAVQGSRTVLINGRPVHRIGDSDAHCGGVGFMVSGSSDVIIGD